MADVIDAASLAAVRSYKKQMKAAAKARAGDDDLLTGIGLLATQDPELGEIDDAAFVIEAA